MPAIYFSRLLQEENNENKNHRKYVTHVCKILPIELHIYLKIESAWNGLERLKIKIKYLQKKVGLRWYYLWLIVRTDCSNYCHAKGHKDVFLHYLLRVLINHAMVVLLFCIRYTLLHTEVFFLFSDIKCVYSAYFHAWPLEFL